MNLHGPVRAPETAAAGKAEVSISLPGWKEAQVAASFHTITIVTPKPGPKPEAVSSRLIRTLVHPDRKANIAEVRFFDGGTRLFAAGYPSGVVQVFDIGTGKELRRLKTPPGYRGSVQYAVPTPDFQTVYVPESRRKVLTFEKSGKKRRRFTYSGEVLAWDLPSGKQLPSLAPSHPDRGVLAAYIAPTGHKLVTVECPSFEPGKEVSDETLLWDLLSRSAEPLGKGYGMAAFSRDNRRLAITLFSTDTEPGRLFVRDLETGRTLFTAQAHFKGRGFSWPIFSPDSKTLAMEDGAGQINKPATVRLYDVDSGKEVAAFPSAGKFPFTELKFSPDGRRLAAGDHNSGVTIWDVAARRVEGRRELPGMRPAAVAFSPDGARLAVLTQAKWNRAEYGASDPDPTDLPQPRVLLFDVGRSGEPEILVCPHGYAGTLAFSPDGKLLGVGASGGVHLFRMQK